MEKQLSRQEREKIGIENTILQHAEKLFSSNGYGNTSMDILADNCEYTKRTIYRYFTCKEDLYFAVLLRGHIRLLENIREKIQCGNTGYEKIRLAYGAFFDFYKNSGSLFDLMSEIRSTKSKKDLHTLPYYIKYADCIRTIYKEIMTLFEMAACDQSIRTDVEAAQLGFSSIFLLNGFIHMLSLCGDSFMDFFSLDKEQFIALTENLLFQLVSGEKKEQ
ncbi:MAG TPA: TetR/AcrR family transcriptional regulator [Clostridia bacterium]|nr:TetR/AcrR family transcriptional regulator [Clostridia bacterium]